MDPTTCAGTSGSTSMDNSLASLYESASSTPVKSSSNHSPRDYPSSLASTSLDFSHNTVEDVILVSDNLQAETSEQHQSGNRAFSLDSSCTLIPERGCPVSEFPVHQHTSPFIDHHGVASLDDKLDCIKILSNNLQLFVSHLSEIDSLEKHITTIGSQLKLLREKVMRTNRESCDLIDKLIHQPSGSSKCDAQTQTDDDICSQLQPHSQRTRKVSACENECTDSEVSSRESDSVGNVFSQAHDTPNLHDCKFRFRKLPAFVKGYLIRRLMQTEKVKQLKRTICDTSTILVQFKTNLFRGGKLVVTHQDILFHQRLCIQLENSCKEFYAVFFETAVGRQMDLISQHREYLKNLMYLKEKRTNSALSQGSSSLASHHYLSARFAKSVSVSSTNKMF